MKKFRPLKDSYLQTIIDRHRWYLTSPCQDLNFLREVYMPVRLLDPSRRKLVRKTAAAVLNGKNRARTLVLMTEAERLAVTMCATEQYFLRMARLEPGDEAREVSARFWPWLAARGPAFAFLALPTRSAQTGIQGMTVFLSVRREFIVR